MDSPNGAATTLEAGVARFLGDLAVARSSETVKTYRAGLNRFVEFLSTLSPAPADVGELTADHPVDFVRWLAGPTARRATIQLYATAVARFYAFLVRERLRPDLELELMRLRLAALRGKRVRGLPRVPADGAVEQLVAVARAAPPGDTRAAECIRLRNVAVVETLRGSGLRVSELVSLKRGDLDRELRRAVVTGKGSKQRLVFFTDPAWRAIETYLEARRDGAGGRGLSSLPLFARHDARRQEGPAAADPGGPRDRLGPGPARPTRGAGDHAAPLPGLVRHSDGRRDR